MAAVGAFLAGGMVAGAFCYWHKRKTGSLQSALFASVPNPRQAVDAEGRTLYANPAFYEFFGGEDRPTPELLLKEVGDDEETHELIERLWANARTGVSGQAEISVPAKGGGAGGAFDWRLVVAHAVEGRPGVIYWAVDDITSRRQVEEVIREEQARFVDLLEHAPIGFYSVDETGRFLFANRTLMEWLRYPHEALEDGTVKLHDVVDDGVSGDTPPHNPFGNPEASYGEVTLKTATGTTFNASVNQEVVRADDGERLRTRSVVRDLTRERAMAEALERSEERFGRFFQEAPVGIALMDPDGEITECNPAFCEMVGQDPHLVRRARLVDLVQDDDRQVVEQAFAVSSGERRRKGAQAQVEIHLGRGSGTDCRLYLSRMEGDDRETLGYIAHFIDTTDQKKLELQFAQSQKMQAVGQLAGGIAHDFNNLLTAMIGFSDLLLLRHRPGDQSFADIMQIKQNASRAANLVRQLLAFSSQQTMQPRRLSVTDTLAELAHLLRRLIGENIELKISHERDLRLVKADQGQLEQVIINLAVNARDAMPGGGDLSIGTSNANLAQDRERKGEIMPAGDYVLIQVSDTGSGIEPENLDRIFEPFFSTKGVGEGTGLGLATVYGIIKQSGGFVFVESRPGEGTEFSIYLPGFEGAEEEATAADAGGLVKRDLSGRGTLLLVEDEDAVRSFGARALRNKGYTVLEANSGEAAVTLLEEETPDVDLVITDVVMPKLDGPGLVQHIRQATPDIKVIFISGYTEDAFRKSLGEDEHIHFLPKPFSLKQLAGKVKEVLEE